MAKKNRLMEWALVLVSVLTSLAIGSAMAGGVLTLPWGIPAIVGVVTGWTVMGLAVLGLIMKIASK